VSGLFWLRYATRSLKRSGRRALFALLCVVVGVAGVVALQTAALTVQDALTSNVRAANGGDVSMTSETAPISHSDLGVFSQLQRARTVSSWTAVSRIHATAVGLNRQLIPFDADIVRAPPFPVGGQPTFVSPGNGNVAALLHGHGDVLVTSVLADELGAGVGTRLFVTGLGGSGLHATIRGILAETSFEHSAVMTIQQRDAAALTNRGLTYSAVYINVPGGNGAPVAGLLRARFPLAGVSTVQDALQSARLEVHDFRQFLLLVGLFALLIAGVGILNAMQSMLAWRRLEIAMLKAMGFGHGTLYALFGVEALFLGLTGGVGGTVLGALTSKAITDALARAIGVQVNFRLDPGTLLGGVALGLGATLIFSVLPIVRAASFRPLEILREGSGQSASGWLRTIGMLALVVFLFGILAAAIVGDTLVAAQFVLGAFLACTALSGLFAIVVTWVGRVGRPRSRGVASAILIVMLAVTALAFARLPSLAPILLLIAIVWAATVVLPQKWLLSLLIAGRSLSRRRSRTSVTLVAFLAGILAMTVTLTVALSLQGQINLAIASAGKVNLVAVSNPSDERAVMRASDRLPGIQSRTVTSFVTTQATAIGRQSLSSYLGSAPSSGGDGENDRGRLFDGITGYNLRAGDGPTGIHILAGRPLSPSDAGTAHVLLRGALMDYPFGLRPGDRVTLRGDTAKTVQVVGFYARPRSTRGFGTFFVAPVLGDSHLVDLLGGPDVQRIISFVIDKQRLTHDAALLQRAVPGVLVIDVGDLAAVVETILSELLNVLDVITALVLGAGTAVVANGVALAMFERRREIALYKAVGFGPSSVLHFVLVENALIGTIAGAASVLAAAIALGLLSRLALQRAVGFDPVLAVYVLAAAVVLAVFTAYLAARAPIGVRPLEALRNE